VNAFEQIALAWQALLATARQAVKPGMWVPWAILGAVQAVAVGLMALVAHPAVSGWLAPPLVRLAGDMVLHYPNVFRSLPALQSRIGFGIDTLLGVVMAGAATASFAARFDHRPLTARAGLARGGRRAGALVLAHLPLQLAVLALTFGLPAWLASRGSAGMTRKAAELFGLGGTVLLQGGFLLLTPIIVIGGVGARAALRELPNAIGRAGVATLTLAVFATLLVMPFHTMLRFTDRVVDLGMPELVTCLVLADVAAALVAGFLLAGATTLIYQSIVMDVEEGW
jgi:hypothetical protein